MTTFLRRWGFASTLAIAGLSIASSLLGLFRPDHYNDPQDLLARMYAVDAMILFVAVPVLLIGLWSHSRGSARGQVIWLGALAFMTYQWASIAGQTAFNQFFHGYIVLFALSVFTLVGGLLDVDPGAISGQLEGRISRRVYSGFLAFVALALAALWLANIVPAMLSGTTPSIVQQLGEQATHTYVLDLDFVVPSLAIAALWLWRGRRWGYVVTGVLLVMAAILAPVLTVLTVVDLQGEVVTITGPLLVGTIVPPAIGAAFALKYLWSMSSARGTMESAGVEVEHRRATGDLSSVAWTHWIGSLLRPQGRE